MGADWYYCFSFFGYNIQVPQGITYRKFVKKLCGPGSIVKEPFMITALLPEFHSRMEGADELSYLDHCANIVIGFYPSGDLNKMVELNKDLSEYITDNPLFEGITISSTPEFYSGINWFDNVVDYESDESDESEESEESEESDESDESEESEESDESDESDKSDESDESDESEESSRIHSQ
jgi:hypothetical protein